MLATLPLLRFNFAVALRAHAAEKVQHQPLGGGGYFEGDFMVDMLGDSPAYLTKRVEVEFDLPHRQPGPRVVEFLRLRIPVVPVVILVLRPSIGWGVVGVLTAVTPLR